MSITEQIGTADPSRSALIEDRSCPRASTSARSGGGAISGYGSGLPSSSRPIRLVRRGFRAASALPM
ncbi:hypothetical protein [Paracoccus cavernae]|uniref:hypothetical protein n=1 Tax=Paracoccus cavernae TaxID=1571207 RepID=UPI0036400D38